LEDWKLLSGSCDPDGDLLESKGTVGVFSEMLKPNSFRVVLLLAMVLDFVRQPILSMREKERACLQKSSNYDDQ
jgi:hypothetical protein